MSLLHNSNAIDAGGYLIERSLRFNPADSTYLNRTPASNTSSTKKGTFSCWLKIGLPYNGKDCIVEAADTYARFQVYSDNSFYFGDTSAWISTAAKFRDYSAWYYVVFVWDTTLSTTSDRMIIYVNNVRQTIGSTFNNQPSQNANFDFLNTTQAYTLGRRYNNNSEALNGYMTEIHFIDGQALTPSSFGEIDTDTRVWKPKAYSGTYGTNGFFLKFADNSGTTATTLGKDSSGNGNNWTPNNFSVTAGAGNDSLVDSPTSYGSDTGAGGEVRGNYATLNPIDSCGGSSDTAVFLNGNLEIQAGTQGTTYGRDTRIGFGVTSGKWYFECSPTLVAGTGNNFIVGWMQNQAVSTDVAFTGAVTLIGVMCGYSVNTTTSKYSQATSSSTITGASTTAGDLISIAVDFDNGKYWIGKGGQYYNGSNSLTTFDANSPTGTFTVSGIYRPYADPISGSGGANKSGGTFNFGQRPFAYTAPSGFKALCTQNLPAVTINNPKTYMDIKTYTGNGSNLQIGEIQKAVDLVTINNSLRFRGSNSAYLNRTPASAGNRKTWTYSAWVKRGLLGADRAIFASYSSSVNLGQLYFLAADTLTFYDYTSGYVSQLNTTQVFRDPAAWLHIVISYDTTQGTAANRIKMYVNGTQVTAFATATYPSQNYDGYINSNLVHYISTYNGVHNIFDGYLADVHFIDGTAHEPTAFGQFDANSYWVPKTPSGLTYGTNGFKLNFSDIALTSGSNSGLGKDTSGNTNYWNTNNISVTSGATYDAMIDTPTNNFATLNSISHLSAGATFSNGNLQVVTVVSGDNAYPATIFASSGKWYAEFTQISVASGQNVVGVIPPSFPTSTPPGFSTNSYAYRSGGNKAAYSIQTAYGATYTDNDIIGVALDLDNGKIWFSKNGTWQASGDPAAGTNAAFTGLSGLYTFAVGDTGSSSNGTILCNFGQRAFAYSQPTGFVALSENNVAEVTDDLEQPDLVWIKSRTGATNHMLFDRVRGVNKHLSSSTTDAESTDVNSLIQFNKNGFYIGNNSNINTSASTYVAWMWKANGAGATNNQGTTTSTVSASTTAGFSIVKWTNPSAATTIGHGLGVTPLFIFRKSTNFANNWSVWHGSVMSSVDQYMLLNSTNAVGTDAGIWGATVPNATTFGITPSKDGGNGNNMIAYCFAPIAGYSAFGSYTGNGLYENNKGVFVYTNFKPRYIFIKRTSGSYLGEWYIWDVARDIYNVVFRPVSANSSALENNYWPPWNGAGGNGSDLDILSNGFKLRDAGAGSAAGFNKSGDTYIYAAFAETPFKYTLAR